MSIAQTLQEIFARMPQAFVPEKAGGIEATIQLNLTGDDGGQWVIAVAEGGVMLNPGRADTPNLSLTMAAGDYVALSLGQTSPMALFMTGKVKVQGDVALAMKFQDMFDRSRVM